VESPVASSERHSDVGNIEFVPVAKQFPGAGFWGALATWEPVWLAPALLILIVAPSSFIPPGLDRAAALFLIVPWVVRLLAFGRPTQMTPLDWPLLAFLGMTLVAWWPSVDHALSWHIFKVNLLGLSIYFTTVNAIATPRRMRRAVMVLIGTGFVVAVLTVVGTDWIVYKLGGLGGIYEQLPKLNIAALNPLGFHPNVAAGLLVMFIPLGVALVIDGLGLWRLVAALLALVVSMVLVLTQSRGGLIGAGGAVVLVLLIRVRFARWLSLLMIPLLVVASTHLGSLPAMLDQVLPFEPGGGFAERVELWQRAIYMIQDFAFTGIGMGTFPVVVNLLYPLFLHLPGRQIPHAHQTFLQMAVDFGVPGFVAWFGALNAWFALSLGAIRRAASAWQRGVAIGFVGAVVAVLAHGLVDASVIYSTKGTAVFWFILGLQVCLWRLIVAAARRTDNG